MNIKVGNITKTLEDWLKLNARVLFDGRKITSKDLWQFQRKPPAEQPVVQIGEDELTVHPTGLLVARKEEHSVVVDLRGASVGTYWRCSDPEGRVLAELKTCPGGVELLMYNTDGRVCLHAMTGPGGGRVITQ